MKSILYMQLIIAILIACSQVTNKSNSSKRKNCELFDTVCNFEVCRNTKYIELNDSIQLKPEEKAYAIVQLINDNSGIIKDWKLNLFRILKNDTILFNYTRFNNSEPPNKLIAYQNLLDAYIKNIKLYPIQLKETQEPNCNITIKIDFKKSP